MKETIEKSVFNKSYFRSIFYDQNKVLDKKTCIFVLTLLIVSIFFITLPIKNILYDIYKWHVVQPETIQGGLELLVFLSIMSYFTFKFVNGKMFAYSIIILSMIYLQLHMVLLPALVALIYFESIFSLGNFILKILKIKNSNTLEKYLFAFVIGLSFWSLFAIILSLFGLGNFTNLRVLTLILLILSLIKGINIPFCMIIIEKISSCNKKERIGIIFLLILLLIQYGKINSSFDYDSLWYGLRPEYVLIGQSSFFDNLGLSHFVFYYPKLFELFLVPISNLGSFSYIYSANILFLLLLLITILIYGRSFGANRLESIFLTCILGSIPAISNMASTAKTDIFTTFLIIFGSYFFINFLINEKNLNNNICFGLVLIFLSFGGKFTSFLYSNMLIIGFFTAIIYKYKLCRITFTKIKEKMISLKSKGFGENILFLVVSFLVVIGICYRTYSLTGYPVYPLEDELWEIVGFTSKYPFYNVNEIKSAQSPNNIISFQTVINMYNLLFSPNTSEYGHYVMVWPGNIFAFMFIGVFLTMLLYKYNNINGLMITLTFLPAIVSGLYYSLRYFGGRDGNYYIPPVILTVLALYYFIIYFDDKIKKSIFIILFLFIPLQFMIMFVSHSSWSWGTGKFHFNFTKPILTREDIVKGALSWKGLSKIEDYIMKTNKQSGIGLDYSDSKILFELPCRFEEVLHMTNNIPYIFQNENYFIQYLRWARIEFLIKPKTYESSNKYLDVFYKVYDDLKGNLNSIEIESGEYYLLDISHIIK